MADEWKLEAVHEQFDVFDKLTETYSQIPADDFGTLLNKVNSVIKQHLRTQGTKQNTGRQITAEIIKKSNSKRHINFSFIVIVSNIDVNNRLSKTPIFVIMSGNQSIFIDMNSSVYENWNAFMKNNSLPACTFCFPVDGQYSVGNKLKIDFAKSPSASLSVSTWKFLGGTFASCALVIATFFFKIPPTVLKKAKQLISVANQFSSTIGSTLEHISTLVDVVQDFRNGSLDINKLLMTGVKTLKQVYNNFNKEIWEIIVKAKTYLNDLYLYLYRKLSDFFESASNSSKHAFLAITGRVDTEMNELQETVEQELNAVEQNNMEAQHGYETATDSVVSEQTNRHVDETMSYVNNVFKNCTVDCALQNGINSKDSESLSSQLLSTNTNDLLFISSNIAKKLHCTSLSDLQDILEALSSLVHKEYFEKIKTYTKMVNAAIVAAGHPIDLEKFNASLGINGDPKEHYWKIVIQSLQQFCQSFQIKAKIQMLNSQKKICTIPLYERSDLSVYKINGKKGDGQISPRALIDILKKNSVNVHEDRMIIKTIFQNILIQSEDLTVMMHQEAVDENTFEGIVLIKKNE